MPLRKPNMRNADPLSPLGFRELRRPDEILHPQPLLQPFLAKLQVFRRHTIRGGEPRIETRAHQCFVVPEIRNGSNAEW